MKNTNKTITTILICTTLLFACKKKDSNSDSNSTTTTTTGPSIQVNSMTASLNNQSWSMLTNSQGYSAYSVSKVFNTYYFTGQTNFTNPYSAIQLSFTYTTGAFSLSSFGNFTARYKDTSNTYYTSRTGTINITTLDTLSANQGLINKFKATFSFKTDTINNKSYTVTNGSVDYKKN